MSEVLPSVRAAIRARIIDTLFQRPGKWLATNDLLELIDEAETSGTLASLCSDLVKQGRLMRGPKTVNKQGKSCNTWGLTHAERSTLYGKAKKKAEAKARENVIEALEVMTARTAAKAEPTLSEGAKATAKASMAEPKVTPKAPAAVVKVTAEAQLAIGTDPQPLPAQTFEDESPLHRATPATDRPAAAMDNPVAPAAAGPVAPAASAPADSPEDDAARTRQAREDHALEDQALEEMTRLLQARAADPGPDITLPVIPERWMPEIRVKLLAMEGPDTEITLRVMTEGVGSYWSMKTSHRTPLDPSDADFLPVLGRGLCAVMDTLCPPEQRLAVAARETAKATRPDPAGARISRPAGLDAPNPNAGMPSPSPRGECPTHDFDPAAAAFRTGNLSINPIELAE